MLDPKCIYGKSIFAKCTRLACLLSFASLLKSLECGRLSIIGLQRDVYNDDDDDDNDDVDDDHVQCHS